MSKGKRLELVLDVLEQLKEFANLTRNLPEERRPDLKANIFVFNSVFRAYEINGENQDDFEEAFALFEEMLRRQPNVTTFITMLSIACKMRYRDHGVRLLAKMKRSKAQIKAKASKGELEELETLKARLMKLPLSPEATMALKEEERETPGTVIDGKVV